MVATNYRLGPYGGLGSQALRIRELEEELSMSKALLMLNNVSTGGWFGVGAESGAEAGKLLQQ